MELNCANCGAPKQYAAYQDVFRCEHCGTLHVPVGEQLDGVVMLNAASTSKCPQGHGALRHARTDEWKLEKCPGCAGLFMSGRTFWELVQYRRLLQGEALRPPRPIPARDLERRITCPQCGYEMSAHPYYGPGGFVIDHCSECLHVWLDHGELEEASRAERKHGH